MTCGCAAFSPAHLPARAALCLSVFTGAPSSAFLLAAAVNLAYMLLILLGIFSYSQLSLFCVPSFTTGPMLAARIREVALSFCFVPQPCGIWGSFQVRFQCPSTQKMMASGAGVREGRGASGFHPSRSRCGCARGRWRWEGMNPMGVWKQRAGQSPWMSPSSQDIISTQHPSKTRLLGVSEESKAGGSC